MILNSKEAEIFKPYYERLRSYIDEYARHSGLVFENEKEAVITLIIDTGLEGFPWQEALKNELQDLMHRLPNVAFVAALKQELALLYPDQVRQEEVLQKLQSRGLI